MVSSVNLDLLNVRLPMEDESLLFRVSVRGGTWTQIQAQEANAVQPEFVSLEKCDLGKAAYASAVCQLDLEGKMLLPGLVDSHMHLDKSFSLTSVENRSGTLEEAVRNYAAASPAFTKHEIKSRIMRSAMQALSFGTTHIRTHLDFNIRASREVALRTIEAALEAKQALSPYIGLQLFPMIPYGISGSELEAVEEAIRMGVDGIGAAPHLSPTPEKDIDRIFALAEKYGLPIDLHSDETDDPSMRTVEHTATRTQDYGFGGRVTVDHLCALASMSDEDARRIIESMADAGLMAVSLPAVNLYLQGRRDRFPVRRGVTRLKEIWEAGIPIAVASDNIHDPFHPFGRGDLVQIALIASYAAHMGRPSDLRTLLRMITDVPAAVLGLEQYGVKRGCAANFVIIDAQSPEELFTLLPDRRWVYSRGKWVRAAAGRAHWTDSALSGYWEQAKEAASFRKREDSEG